jgi:phage gp45-like
MADRDNITPMIKQAALQAYRGVCTAYSEHSVTGGYIGTIQGTGRRTGPLATDKETLNAVQLGRTYGLDSAPPADTELVYLETQSGVIVACERYRRPSITQGQVILFDGNGAEIKLTYGTGASRRVEIGKGGTMKDAARKGDTVTQTAGFDTWVIAVRAACVAGGGGDPGAPASFGTVTTGSATVGIED